MEQITKNYEIGEFSFELPTNPISVKELEIWAEELGHSEIKDMEELLQSSGVNVEEGVADFNDVLIFLMEKGIVSIDFLMQILESNFHNDDYIPMMDIVEFVCSIGNGKDVSKKNERKVIMALGKLVS